MSGRNTETADRKFRLLIMSSDKFPPRRVDVAVLFGEKLAERNHRIDWILQSESPCDRSYEQEWGGGRAYIGPTDLGTTPLSRLRKHLLSIRHDLKVLGRARSGDYDVIKVRDKFIGGVIALVAAKLFRTRFVYWLSYPFPEDTLARVRAGTARYPAFYWIRAMTFGFLLYRVLLPRADRVFLQSKQMRADVTAKGIRPDRLIVVPMGIEISAFERLRASQSPRAIPETDRCFLYLGSLDKMRRLDFLIRVLARVRERAGDIKLYLVGAGEDPGDEAMLHAEVDRLELQSAVIFTGQLPWSEAQRYVRDADVCVSPIYPAPFLNAASPTKIVEYLAMGRPVVANEHPDQKVIVQESGAGLCVPWDEGEFADAVVKLLMDPDAARTMGERGPEYVARYRSYDIIADQVERELLNVAHGDA